MYKTILLPIDLAHESSWKQAVPVAITLAGLSGATIHCLAVVPDLATSVVGQFFPPGYEQKALKSAAEALETFAGEHLVGVPHEVHVTAGSVYTKILDAADELNCDLIVMASHRPEITDYLIGPNADRVVRHAKISVHVVRG